MNSPARDSGSSDVRTLALMHRIPAHSAIGAARARTCRSASVAPGGPSCSVRDEDLTLRRSNRQTAPLRRVDRVDHVAAGASAYLVSKEVS
jgi:hypothetical protein